MEETKAQIVAIKNLLTRNFSSFDELKREFKEELLCQFMIYEIPNCSLVNKFKGEKYLGMGRNGMGILATIKDSPSHKLVMKIIPYYFKKERTRSNVNYASLPLDNKRRPENVEYQVLELLNKRILKAYPSFPHIVILVDSFICNRSNPVFQECMERLKNNIEEYKDNQIFTVHDYRITLIEYAEFGSLDKFLMKGESFTEEIFVQLLLQIIAALTFFHRFFPTFRHNDMHPGNILLQKYSKPLTYTIDELKYKIPDPTFCILINDFDFSEIKPRIINQKVRDFYGNDFNNSQYYDIHTFINTLHSAIATTVPLPTAAYYKFMEKVVPSFIRGFVVYMDPKTLKTNSFIPLTRNEKNSLEEKYISEGWKQIINHHRFIVSEKILSPLFAKHNFDVKQFYPLVLIKDSLFRKFKV